MSDDDLRALLYSEVVMPGLGGCVEVAGRFVEEQHGWPLDQSEWAPEPSAVS